MQIIFFRKVIQGQIIVNFVFSNSLAYFFIPILKEIIFLNPTICHSFIGNFLFEKN
jgi:hypothetical protein